MGGSPFFYARTGGTMNDETTNTTTLRRLLEPPVDALGYELLHLEIQGAGGGRVLRVYIDAPGGIGVDDCAAVSRRLSAVLEVEDAAADCALEVSSPGLDRPLVKMEHFQRFAGARARIVLNAPKAGRRKFTGELSDAGVSGVALIVDGERMEFAYDDLDAARLAPVF